MCVLRYCVPNMGLHPLRRESGYAHNEKGVTTKCAVTPFTNSTVLQTMLECWGVRMLRSGA